MAWKELFGSDPNDDFRARWSLQRPDKSNAYCSQCTRLKARGLDAGGRAGAPIEMEAIAGGQTFHLTIKVDNRLFDAWAQRGFGGNGWACAAQSIAVRCAGTCTGSDPP